MPKITPDIVEQIDAALETIDARLSSIDARLTDQGTLHKENTLILKEHMARTAANESRIIFVERFLMTSFLGGVVAALIKLLFL